MSTLGTRSATDGSEHARRASEDRDSLWERFSSPADQIDFCGAWLGLVCEDLGGVETGLLLVKLEDGSFAPAGIWPDIATEVTQLGEAAEKTLNTGRGVVSPLIRPHPSGERRTVALGYPLFQRDELTGAVILELTQEDRDWKGNLRRVHWASAWLTGNGPSRAEPGQADGNAAAAFALASVASAADESGPEASLLALCNALASRLRCDRVSLGLRRRTGFTLTAGSYTTEIKRRNPLAQSIESAMDEAAFQHRPIILPVQQEAPSLIAVAHEKHCRSFGVAAIMSMVVRAGGDPVAVITCERTLGPGFSRPDADALELTAVHAAHLVKQHAHALAWSGDRAPRLMRDAWDRLRADGRPGWRYAATAAVALLAAACLYPAQFRITARAVLEGEQQRAAVAPFQGFVSEAFVRAGDEVRAGQRLALLDDRDLRLERQKWQSEVHKSEQREREALAKNDRAAMLAAHAQLEQARAELALATDKLERSVITAPIDGVVVTGDLSQMLGSPVEQGKVLFELAPLDRFRVAVRIPEQDIRFVRGGEPGLLKLSGASGQMIPVEITRVTAVATAEDGHNVFRAEASLQAPGISLRPGMEGVAKIVVGRRPLLWVLFRPALDRIRIVLWSWAP